MVDAIPTRPAQSARTGSALRRAPPAHLSGAGFLRRAARIEASIDQCGSFVCHHGFFKQFIIRAEFDAELVKRRGITAETLEELFQLPHRFAKIVQAAPNDKDIDVADRRSVPEDRVVAPKNASIQDDVVLCGWLVRTKRCHHSLIPWMYPKVGRK